MVYSSEQVAPHTKEVLHEPVHRQKALGVSDRLEPSHLLLALLCRLMRDLGSVVFVLHRAVDDRRHHDAVRRPITEKLVRDQALRHAALPFQQFPKETRGRTAIAPRLDEDVDHVTVLVDGPPEILTAALDIHE
jgi:hypothetical protein